MAKNLHGYYGKGGGNVGNGGNCGLLYANCNNGPGNANWNIAARNYELDGFQAVVTHALMGGLAACGASS